MAIYRFEARIIDRGQASALAAAYRSGGKVSELIQRSAVACAAYHHQGQLRDHRTGEAHDFRLKQHVEHSEILTPEEAPTGVYAREQLSKRVEQARDKSTRRATAQLARELLITLTRDLSADQRVALVRTFVRY